MLPKINANFRTTLVGDLSKTGTAFTLARSTDDDGAALTGSYLLTFDEGLPREEHMLVTLNGAAGVIVTRGLSRVDMVTSKAANIFKHYHNASVKVTDAVLTRVANMLNGGEALPAVPKNPATRVISDPRHLVDKEQLELVAGSPLGLPALAVTDAGGIAVDVAAGRFMDGDAIVDYAGASAFALTDDATNYVFLTRAGVLTANTTGFTDGTVPLAVAVCAGGDIASLTDRRPFFTLAADTGLIPSAGEKAALGLTLGTPSATNKAVSDADTVGTPKTGAITHFSDAGGGKVRVESAAHGMRDGQSVTISGTTSYNGTFVVSGVAADTYDITDTWVADDATGTWAQSAADSVIRANAAGKVDPSLLTAASASLLESVVSGDILKATASGIRKVVGWTGSRTNAWTNLTNVEMLTATTFVCTAGTNGVRIGTIGASAVTFGTTLTLTGTSVIDIAVLSPTRFLVLYLNSTTINVTVCSVSGTDITPGNTVSPGSTGSYGNPQHLTKVNATQALVQSLGSNYENVWLVTDSSGTISVSSVAQGYTYGTQISKPMITSATTLVTLSALETTYYGVGYRTWTITGSSIAATSQGNSLRAGSASDYAQMVTAPVAVSATQAVAVIKVQTSGPAFKFAAFKFSINGASHPTFVSEVVVEASLTTDIVARNAYLIDGFVHAVCATTSGLNPKVYRLDPATMSVLESYQTAAQFVSNAGVHSNCYDPFGNRIVIASYSSPYGLLLLLPDILQFAGIADSSKAAGQSVTFDTLITASGLTPGMRYYVATSGQALTTASTSGQQVGLAVGATQIIRA